MQIFTKYIYQSADGPKSYTVVLMDSVCTCSEDNTDNSIALDWDGTSVTGDMPSDVLIGVSALIAQIIQNSTAAGIILKTELT